MSKGFKITLVMFIIVLAVAGYWQYSSKYNIPEEDDGVISPIDESSKEEKEITEALNTLKSINIDTDFFNDEIFSNLIDFSRDLIPESVGRPNPFLPI